MDGTGAGDCLEGYDLVCFFSRLVSDDGIMGWIKRVYICMYLPASP